MPIGGIEFHKVSTNEWVDMTQRDPLDEDGLRLRGAGHDGTGYLTVFYADIPGNSWNQNRLNLFMRRANQLLEKRIPLTDPSLVDDPMGLTLLAQISTGMRVTWWPSLWKFWM